MESFELTSFTCIKHIGVVHAAAWVILFLFTVECIKCMAAPQFGSIHHLVIHSSLVVSNFSDYR